MPITYLLFFALALTLTVYLLNSLVAKKFKSINPKEAFLYITTVAMLGVIAEVVIGNLYFTLFGSPLWNYTVLPLHDAYTSLYAPFLWGIYGFQIYLIHDTFESKGITSLAFLIPFICIEAILFEAIVNLSFLVIFEQFLYYYYPSDLFHLTSVQTLPFYLLAGFVITGVLNYMRKRKRIAILLNIIVTFLAVGIL